MSSRLALIVMVGWAVMSTTVWARMWTDSTGKYSVDASLIAANDEVVILKKENSELVSVPIAKLSDADREYLKSIEAGNASRQADQVQTWTMRSGLKVVGKVVDYAKKDVTIQRRRGKIYVNDRHFENLPGVYQQMLPLVVGHFENMDVKDKSQFDEWVVKQKGQPHTFNLEGVILELENGDEYLVPFFFFSPDDLSVLQPGWNRWLAAANQTSASESDRSQQAFMLQSAAKAYQQDRMAKQQIAQMQLDLLAVASGVTDMWEVLLMPGPGIHRSPLSVVVPARDSQSATVAAMQRNPGFVAGPARRVNRR